MISTLIKPLLPIIRKNIESGKIDEVLDQLREQFRVQHEVGSIETVEFILTKEPISEKYIVSVVGLHRETDVVRALDSFWLKDVIENILKNL